MSALPAWVRSAAGALGMLAAAAAASLGAEVRLPEPPGGVPEGARLIIAERDEESPELIEAIRARLAADDPLFAVVLIEARLARGTVSDRERAQLLELRAECAARLGTAAETIPWVQSVVNLYPQNPRQADILLKLAQTYAALGAYTPARDTLYRVFNYTVRSGSASADRDVVDLDELTLRTGFLLAEAEFAAGDMQRAAELFERVELQSVGNNTFAPAAAHRRSVALLKTGGAEAAESAAVLALRAHPDHPLAPETLIALLRVFAESGRMEELRGALDQLRRRAASVPEETRQSWLIQIAEIVARANVERPWILRSLQGELTAIGEEAQPLRDWMGSLLNRQSRMRLAEPAPAGDDDLAHWRSGLEAEREALRGKLDRALR